MRDGISPGRQLVVLMRHAEAGQAADGGSDFERTLTRRGEADAEAVARRLAEEGWTPARVLCSAAWRTRQTFSIASRVWGGSVEAEYRHDLYLAEPDAIDHTIRKALMVNTATGDELPPALLLVGHNPGIEALASRWAEKVVPMPTAAAVVFAFEVGETAEAEPGEKMASSGDHAWVHLLQMVDRIVPGEPRGR